MIRTCSSCGARNRVPPEHLTDRGRCGACKAPFGPADAPIEADAVLFDAIVQRAQVPVLVDFWAAWCAPCRMAAPEVRRAAADLAGAALVLKVDTERHPEIAARYGVRGIPNFVVFRDGRVVLQRAGLVGHDQLEAWLRQAA